jgi:hypothetical protein
MESSLIVLQHCKARQPTPKPACGDYAHVACGVRIGRGGMSALSPFYPQLRTLVGAAGTAASCQQRP